MTASQQPTNQLEDYQIEQLLTDGFPPHRCVVEFQDDRRKVVLRVRRPSGAEFVVEGKRVDSLRDPDALGRYIQDVRTYLLQHRLRFYDVPPASITESRGGATRASGDLLINVDDWRNVRYWSRKFGCTQSVLRAAVNVLGPKVKDVEPYVKRRSRLGCRYL